ncbi:Tic20 family protein [Baaleninema simplex]|uniref:Tic20 family protein n=1 Tax=Baaleninema simplex TaxID=2862350 RepID=UPI000346082F|nr:Tic20 family protein [Baaleninema simplex]
MTWRGSSSPFDRVFACLVYLLPLLEAVTFGSYLFNQIPILGQLILVPLSPFISVYGLISAFPFGRLILFFVLLLAVVRNPRINHFLRFNTMQSLLLSIALFLLDIVLQLVGLPLSIFQSSSNLLAIAMSNLLFLAFFGAAIYAIVQCVRGRYPELPVVSEAAYHYVQY